MTLVPDLVETPGAEQIAAVEQLRQAGRLGALPPLRELPAGSRGVRLQITSLQIMEGLEDLLGRPGGVYVVSSVIDGIGDQAITFQGKVYQGVHDGDMLPLGREGDPGGVFTVYLREGQIPRLLSFSLLVLRSREGLRELGLMLTKLSQDERFRELTQQVGITVAAVNPAYSLVWQAADAAIGLVGEYLAAKPDDQLAYYQGNYTNLFDNLGMGKHPAEGPTIAVGKVRMAYEVNVA